MSSRIALLTILLLTTVIANAAPRRVIVDPAGSSITFEVRATLHSFTGTAGSWNLEITLPDDGDRPDSALLTLDLSGMRTGNEARDREMMHWMESGKFPAITFRMTALRPGEPAAVAEGEFTLHGETRSITIPVQLGREGNRISVAGEVVIDHREHGLKQFRKLGLLTVSPEVKVAFKISGVLE